jgi:predicted nucleic acid-binding protein
MTIVIDTTVWIDYFANRATQQVEWLEREMPSRRLGLVDISLCEILQGIRDDRLFASIRNDLLGYEVINSGGVNLAILSAQNYRLLRSRGVTIRKTTDCIIASICISHRYPLLHNDRDFVPFEEHLGLQVIHP